MSKVDLSLDITEWSSNAYVHQLHSSLPQSAVPRDIRGDGEPGQVLSSAVYSLAAVFPSEEGPRSGRSTRKAAGT